MCSKVNYISLNAWLYYLVIITIHISDWRHFSDFHISQGSVATCFRHGGIFKHEFIANLLPRPSVKEVWISVRIWRSYGQEFGVVFLTHCVDRYLLHAPELSSTARRSCCRSTGQTDRHLAGRKDTRRQIEYVWPGAPVSGRRGRLARLLHYLHGLAPDFSGRSASTSEPRPGEL